MVIGAAINAAAIAAGGGLGLLARGRLDPKHSDGVMKALGLCILVIGTGGALGGDMMLLVVSLALGALSGELARIHGRLEGFGAWVQGRLSAPGRESSFAQGFVTSSLLFCVGAMAIVGSLDSGLLGDRSVVVTKSIIDGIASVFLASTLGAGVLFSALAVFAYQGAIEFFAAGLAGAFTDELIAQISAVGGVMVMGLGANMAFGTQIKVANLLPSFAFAALYHAVI